MKKFRLRNALKAFFQTQQARYFVSTKPKIHRLAEGHPSNPDYAKKGDEKVRPKEEYDTRKIVLKFRVSKEESDLIESKFQNSGYKSKSDFIRMIIFQGQIIKISDEFLSDFRRKYSSISNNINQIECGQSCEKYRTKYVPNVEFPLSNLKAKVFHTSSVICRKRVSRKKISTQIA